jgi:dimethylhistidine N-methyltransferase
MEFQNSLQSEVDQQFLTDVLDGLSRPAKCLPSKYFYDKRGSELFDQICELDEYYPTRTEIEIMGRYAKQMAEYLNGSSVLVEFGSGSSIKTDYLLSHLHELSTYVPVDISAEHLAIVGEDLEARYPNIDIEPIADDFTQLDSLPIELALSGEHSVYFPGSTIGNFPLSEAKDLLTNIAHIIEPGGVLLLGVDLVKDARILEAAYNDSLGVTAEFNLNVLRRINEELGGEFDLESFQHVAYWNDAHCRIEMHLRSQSNQAVSISGMEFLFQEGETICTEYSHKYRIQTIKQLAARSGLELTACWTDDDEWFAVACLQRIRKSRRAPIL